MDDYMIYIPDIEYYSMTLKKDVVIMDDGDLSGPDCLVRWFENGEAQFATLLKEDLSYLKESEVDFSHFDRNTFDVDELKTLIMLKDVTDSCESIGRPELAKILRQVTIILCKSKE